MLACYQHFVVQFKDNERKKQYIVYMKIVPFIKHIGRKWYNQRGQRQQYNKAHEHDKLDK